MATSMFRDDPTAASRYLADQLTESERRAYEAALAQDPEVLRELEATARLKVGLDHLRETGKLAGLMRESRLKRTQFALAMAAAIVAVVLGIGLLRSRFLSPQPSMLAATARALLDRSGHQLSLVGTQSVFRSRSETYDATIELPSTGGVLKLRVMPDTDQRPARYKALLTRVRDDDSEESLATVADLRPDNDNIIAIYMDLSKFTPGRYRLIVNGETADGQSRGSAGSFLLKFVASNGISRSP
jgi:hypothetical protein